MFADILARLKHTNLVVDRANAIQTELRSESWPALAHTRWLCAVAYVEELTASALFGVQRRPDTESRDGVDGGFVEERELYAEAVLGKGTLAPGPSMWA